MDDILSEFITETSAEPALAQDLLEAAGWNLQSALDMYHRLMGTQSAHPQPQDRHSESSTGLSTDSSFCSMSL